MKAIEYLNQYKTEKKGEKSNNTVKAYISDIQQFQSFLSKDFEGVTNTDIDSYKRYLLEHGMKPKTINRKLVSLRKYIEYLHSETNIRMFVEIRLIKIQRQEYLEEILTKSDFDRLIHAAEVNKDKRALAVFYGLYLTGARVSEFLQWKIKDISNDTITIKGKGDKFRDLFRSDSLKFYLTDYIGKRETTEDAYVFLNIRNDNPMDRVSVHNLIKKYAGKAKIKLTKAHAHNFRHLCAFRLIEEGLTLDEVADILGHTDINTTRIYTRKTKSELMKAMNRLK